MALTWKNVDIPSGGGNSYGGVNNTFNQALDGLLKISQNNEQRRIRENTAGVLGQLAGVSSMDEYRSLVGGIDFNSIDPTTQQHILGIPDTLARRSLQQMQESQISQNISASQQQMRNTSEDRRIQADDRAAGQRSGVLQDELLTAALSNDSEALTRIGGQITDANPNVDLNSMISGALGNSTALSNASLEALNLAGQQKAYDDSIKIEDAKKRASVDYLTAERNYNNPDEMLTDYYRNTDLASSDPEYRIAMMEEIENNRDIFGRTLSSIKSNELQVDPEIQTLMGETEYLSSVNTNRYESLPSVQLDRAIEDMEAISQEGDPEGQGTKQGDGVFDAKQYLIDMYGIKDDGMLRKKLDVAFSDIRKIEGLEGVDDRSIAAAMSLNFDNIGFLQGLLTFGKNGDRILSGSASDKTIQQLRSKFDPVVMREEQAKAREFQQMGQVLQDRSSKLNDAIKFEARHRDDPSMSLVAQQRLYEAEQAQRAVASEYMKRVVPQEEETKVVPEASDLWKLNPDDLYDKRKPLGSSPSPSEIRKLREELQK